MFGKTFSLPAGYGGLNPAHTTLSFHNCCVTRYAHVANKTHYNPNIVNNDLFTSFLLGSP